MAKRKTKRSKSKTTTPALSPRKREELLGVLLMMFGVLTLIALFTHEPGEIPEQAQAGHIRNGLGIVGVYISHYTIHWTIGYPVLVVPFLIIAWGINRFFGKLPGELVTWTLFILLISFYVSMSGSLHSFIISDGRIMGYDFSGFFGAWGARMLQTLFGVYGAIVVLVGLIIITVLLFTTISFAELLQWLSSTAGRGLFQARQAIRRAVSAVTHKARNRQRFQFDRREEIPLKPQEPARPAPPPETEAREQIPIDFDSDTETEEPDWENSFAETSVARELYNYVYDPPSLDYLQYPQESEEVSEEFMRQNAHLLEDTLSDFGIRAEVVEIHPGPVITRYELSLAPGIKVSRITSLADDLAMAMRARRIRIVAPIPGKAAVGIEIPNPSPSIVYLREILMSPEFQQNTSPLTIALGKTASGRPYTADLSTMPHLLVAGSTGSGKSVCLNTIIASFLYKADPSQIQFVLIDPKRLELSTYANLHRHHLQYVSGSREKVATTPKSAINVLKAVEQEMERRYEKLASAGVRKLDEYNERVRDGKVASGDDGNEPEPLPYLVVIVDELADLMLTSSGARDVEEPIARLTQMSRAVGIHLIVATQRPSVDVITGVIKANFPARIAFQVATKVDSRTILDMNGAEKLLGRGDMLFLPPASPECIRIHNAFITLDEIEAIIDHILHQPAYDKESLPAFSEEQAESRNGGITGGRDALFHEAMKVVVRTQQGSVSLLQRKLKVGYSRAARIIDELEEAGVVGPFEGSKARQVLVRPDELENIKFFEDDEEEPF